MTKSTFSLIAVLYDNQQAGLYNDVYFPIIKYTVVSLFYQPEKKEYFSVDDIREYISDNFGLEIPFIVLKKSIVHLAKKDHNIELDIFDKGEEFKIRKAWDYTINQEIENKITRFEEQVNLLEDEYSNYLSVHKFEQDKTFLDFISDNTDDVLDYLKDKSNLKVDEKYTSIAFFLEHLKAKGDNLFIVASDMFWASVIAGFLNREEQDIKDISKVGKAEYFLDTSVVLGLLKLSSASIERYALDLYNSLVGAKVLVRLHPATLYEITSILQSVERNGAYPNTDISFAISKYNYNNSDIASIRANLPELLDKKSITIFPKIETNFVQSITNKYKDKGLVKELATSRGECDNDSFREIHDVFMYDYIVDRQGKLSSYDKCAFVTLNRDLINFFKLKDNPNKHVFIHPHTLTMELWMNGCSSSDLKVAALTESISRCFFLNNVDIRNKIEALSKFYNEKTPDFSKKTFDAILVGLFSRDKELLKYLDEYKDDTGKADYYKAENIRQKIIERGNELGSMQISALDEIKDSLDEAVLNVQNSQAALEHAVSKHSEDMKNVKKQNDEAEEKIKILQEETKHLKKTNEETKENIKSLLSKQTKISDTLNDINSKLKAYDDTMEKSVCYGDFWFMIVIVFLFLVSLIASAILFVAGGESAITLPKVIAYSATVITGLLSLLKFKTDLFHPKVYKFEIKQRQLQYWKQNHPEYEKLEKERAVLKSEFKQINDNLSKLLK